MNDQQFQAAVAVMKAANEQRRIEDEAKRLTPELRAVVARFLVHRPGNAPDPAPVG